MRFRLSALFVIITGLALFLAVFAPADLPPIVLLAFLYPPLPTLAWLVLELLFEAHPSTRSRAFNSCLTGAAGTMLIFVCWWRFDQAGAFAIFEGLAIWAILTAFTWTPQLFVLGLMKYDLTSMDRRILRPIRGLARSGPAAQPHDSGTSSPS